MEVDRVLIIESDNMYDFLNIRTKIIELLRLYNIRFEVYNTALDILDKHLLIDFILKGEKIKYKEYDMITTYELLQDNNLEELIKSFKEGE